MPNTQEKQRATSWLSPVFQIVAITGLMVACTTVPEGNGYHPAVLTAAVQTVQVLQVRPSTSTPNPLPSNSIASLGSSPTPAVPARLLTLRVLPTQSATLPSLHAITPSPDPAKVPPAQIRIMNLGQYSKVVSPVVTEISAIPGANGRVLVELIGEDGRALDRQLLNFYTYPGQRISFTPSLDFEIPGIAEAARLQVSVKDAYERTTALSSVDLILLSAGESEINQPGDLSAPYVIREPASNQEVQGGKLTIDGAARPLSQQPLMFSLINRQGKEIGSRQVRIDPSAGELYAGFSTDIPYQISSPTWALLVARQPGNRIPGDAALTSVPVYLKP